MTQSNIQNMVRKTKTPVEAYVNVSDDEATAVVLATSGKIKNKDVDPRKLIGTVHVKKFLADTKINGEFEQWLEIIRKLTPIEARAPEKLSAKENAVLTKCKKHVEEYLKADAPKALKDRVAKCDDELKNLKDVVSSIKTQFSEATAWLDLIKRVTPVEGHEPEELTPEEVVVFETCKKRVAEYLEVEASKSLQDKIGGSSDELKNLKDVTSSMKFKFSKAAYETVTHAVNLMVREILVFTCDNCAAQRNKLTKPAHVPWDVLQVKQLAGLYMNTKAVFEQLNPEEEEEEENEEEEVVEEVADESTDETPVDTASEASETVEETVKLVKPRLFQYISNAFKEIVSRDERFKGLLLSKDIAALIDSIVFQTLERFANVIKSLLDTANSKTVNERLVVIAAKILLQDHVHANDDDVRVVLNLLQAHAEEFKANEAAKANKTPKA